MWVIRVLMAGIRAMKIRIIMKFRIMTSIDGVEPRKRAAKITEKIIIYTMAIDEMITTYEKSLNQIDAKFSMR